MTNALASQIVPEREKRMQREAPGVAASLLEGLDELLTVSRLGLPLELRRALACTNAIENMQGTIRRVTRNVKRWRDASMVLRWVVTALMEAEKKFRRVKGYRDMPQLLAALDATVGVEALDKKVSVA